MWIAKEGGYKWVNENKNIPTKRCECCGGLMNKELLGLGWDAWNLRKFCSVECMKKRKVKPQRNQWRLK